MTRFFDWFRRRRFQSDARHLEKYTATPESRLHILTRLNDHLRSVTYSRTLISADASPVLRSYAHNCDNLLLDLAGALDIMVSEDDSYSGFAYNRRDRKTVKFADYLISNKNIDVPMDLFARKLSRLIDAFTVQMGELIALDSPVHQHHLRQTSRLVEETINVLYALLAVSDQKLTPPVSSEKQSR